MRVLRHITQQPTDVTLSWSWAVTNDHVLSCSGLDMSDQCDQCRAAA